MDQLAREVCQAFSVTADGFALEPLGNAGGFSGARLWRVETAVGPWCLRAWPIGGHTTESLRPIHRLMQQAGRTLRFVPRLAAGRDGQATIIEAGGRCWELASWQPGQADFHAEPSQAKLAAAGQALANLHLAWSPSAVPWDICPAVRKRIARLAAWEAGPRPGPEAFAHLADPVKTWTARAAEQLSRWTPPALHALAEHWAERKLPLTPCLCDIWHDHVLFRGATVSGIVDYGAAALDSVATDLARLIGSLVGDAAAARAIAIDAYEQVRPLQPIERELWPVLDWTGVVVGAANWLRWLGTERRHFEDPIRVAGRLAELVSRMESWGKQGDAPAPPRRLVEP